MQSLEEMRKELDVIDDQITTLYETTYEGLRRSCRI